MPARPENGSDMRIVVLDFETHYSSSYSLSRMPTASYVRSPQFQVIGFCLRVNGQPWPWVSGSDPQLRQALPDQSWWNDAILVAHNAAFDAAVLSLHFGIRPARICCTLSMARSLGLDHAAGASLQALADTFRRIDPAMPHKGDEVLKALGKRREDFSAEELAAYGAYCATDTAICERLFHHMAPLLPLAELRWQDLVIRMATEPVFELDADLLQAELSRVRTRKSALLSRLVQALGLPDAGQLQLHLASNPKFAQVLQTLAIDPPLKTSQTTGKSTWAFAKTDPAMQTLLEHPDPLVQLVVAARLGEKSTLEETRLEKMLELAAEGPFPLPYKVSGAHTHRLSGDQGINVQNMPSGRIPGQSKAMRRAIRAPSGMVVVAGDSAQVEARILAYLARQHDLLDAFANHGDPYKRMATRIYGVAFDEVQPQQRQVGKNAVLGCGFGMGAARFRAHCRTQAGVILSLEECRKVIDVYRQSNPMIPAFWRRCDAVLMALLEGRSGHFGGPADDLLFYDGARTLFGERIPGVRLPDGLWLNYPGLRLDSVETVDPDTGELRARTQCVYTQTRGKAKLRKPLWGGSLTENLVQAVAFALLKWQATHQIAARYPVKLNTHDEHAIVVIAPEADAATAFLHSCMSSVPPWLAGCPIACEVAFAQRYGDC